MKYVPFLVWLALFFICFIFLGYTGRDDSHISYFAADMLAQGYGLVNYNHEHVDQTSAPLYTFSLSVPVIITGIKSAYWGPFLSAAYLMLSVLVLCIWRPDRAKTPWIALSCFATPMIYWALSGMENSLYLLLILIYILCVECTNTCDQKQANSGKFKKYLILTSLIFLPTLLAWTRPEFPFVLVLALTLYTLLSENKVTNVKRIAIPAIVGTSAALIIRKIAGYNMFPNTVYAKQEDFGLMQRIIGGLEYLLDTFSDTPLTSILAIILLFLCLKVFFLNKEAIQNKNAFLACITFTIAIGSFAILSGGDWMEASRFLTTCYVLVFISAFLIYSTRRNKLTLITVIILFSLFDTIKLAKTSVGGLPFLVSYNHTTTAFTPEPTEYRNVVHARDIIFADKILSHIQSSQDNITIASIQAGMVPYYLFHTIEKGLYFVDLKGLATNHIHDCRNENGFEYDAYAHIDILQECINIKFDYVYDIDSRDWKRLNALIDNGCKEIFRENISIRPIKWKDPRKARIFLADCSSQS